MKKVLFALMLLGGVAYAACVGPYCWDDTGPSLAGLNGSVRSVSYEPGGVVPSTATTTTNSAMWFPAYLTGSVAASKGSLLVGSAPVAGKGVTVAVSAATNGLGTVVGVADAAVSTGSIVAVDVSGVVLALTSGTVSAGDILVSTGTAGYLGTNNSPTAGTIVGRALAAGTAAGGLTRILLVR